jgi:hypothetical protein
LIAITPRCNIIPSSNIETMGTPTSLFETGAKRDVLFYFYFLVVLYAFARNSTCIKDWLFPPHRHTAWARWLRFWLV